MLMFAKKYNLMSCPHVVCCDILRDLVLQTSNNQQLHVNAHSEQCPAHHFYVDRLCACPSTTSRFRQDETVIISNHIMFGAVCWFGALLFLSGWNLGANGLDIQSKDTKVQFDFNMN